MTVCCLRDDESVLLARLVLGGEGEELDFVLCDPEWIGNGRCDQVTRMIDL